jgi:hypothetical protein
MKSMKQIFFLLAAIVVLEVGELAVFYFKQIGNFLH